MFFFQAEDGIRDRSPSRGLGDVYKRQGQSLGASEHEETGEVDVDCAQELAASNAADRAGECGSGRQSNVQEPVHVVTEHLFDASNGKDQALLECLSVQVPGVSDLDFV